MIYLITGVPGAGKSLRGIYRLLDLMKKDSASERTFFANIDGLKIEAVQPSPSDWTTAPDHSVVLYDEAQAIFPSKGKGRSDDKIIQAMETHRHRGIDLILITQHPGLISSHVRKLVGNHEHLTRQFGATAVTVRMLERCWSPDNKSDANAAHSSLWRYPKEYYKLYQSATVHTHKLHLPPSAVRFLVFMVVAVVALALMFPGFKRFISGTTPNSKQQVASETAKPSIAPVPASPASVATGRSPAPPPPMEAFPVKDTVAIGGCIKSERHYGCWDQQGKPIHVDLELAMQVLDGGVGRQLPHGGGGSDSRIVSTPVEPIPAVNPVPVINPVTLSQ